MRLMIVLVLLLLLLQQQLCLGREGVDLTLPLTVEQWTDLNPEFAVVRVIKHTGDIDYTGIRNLRRANDANIVDLAGYMYPCIDTSYFMQTENIKCLSAREQLAALKSAIEDMAGEFQTYDRNTWPPTSMPTGAPSMNVMPSGQPTGQPSGIPTGQPTSAPSEKPTPLPTLSPATIVGVTQTPTSQPTAQPSGQPTGRPSRVPTGQPTTSPTNIPGQKPLQLKRVYLMVEDESPPRYFDADQQVNQAYITELMEQAYEYGFQLGVFTTLRYWTELMEYDGTKLQFSRDNVPLWTPRFDKTANDNFFVPFGGWSTVTMKQYDGGGPEARRLDVTWRINKNYQAQNFTSVTVDPVPGL